MAKFQRLSPSERKTEIKTAAAELFLEKGFSSTTMENIVQRVTLSKGGVYRIYSSTKAILIDIILDGMRLRNENYVNEAVKWFPGPERLDTEAVIRILSGSMLIGEKYAELYVIFLCEMKYHSELCEVYDIIVQQTKEETLALAQKYHVESIMTLSAEDFDVLTDLMNTAILGIVLLDGRESFREHIALFEAALRCFFDECEAKRRAK